MSKPATHVVGSPAWRVLFRHLNQEQRKFLADTYSKVEQSDPDFFQAQGCFANSQKLTIWGAPRIVYIEGTCLDGFGRDKPLAHAWTSIDGVPFDITNVINTCWVTNDSRLQRHVAKKNIAGLRPGCVAIASYDWEALCKHIFTKGFGPICRSTRWRRRS